MVELNILSNDISLRVFSLLDEHGLCGSCVVA